jgi:hypothetical protein
VPYSYQKRGKMQVSAPTFNVNLTALVGLG